MNKSSSSLLKSSTKNLICLQFRDSIKITSLKMPKFQNITFNIQTLYDCTSIHNWYEKSLFKFKCLKKLFRINRMITNKGTKINQKHYLWSHQIHTLLIMVFSILRIYHHNHSADSYIIITTPYIHFTHLWTHPYLFQWNLMVCLSHNWHKLCSVHIHIWNHLHE